MDEIDVLLMQKLGVLQWLERLPCSKKSQGNCKSFFRLDARSHYRVFLWISTPNCSSSELKLQFVQSEEVFVGCVALHVAEKIAVQQHLKVHLLIEEKTKAE